MNCDLWRSHGWVSAHWSWLFLLFIVFVGRNFVTSIYRLIPKNLKQPTTYFCFVLKNTGFSSALVWPSFATLDQSCPWVGSTRGLGWVGSGMGRKFVFLVGWVGSWVWNDRCANNTCRVYYFVTLCRVSTGKFVLWKLAVGASLHHLSEIFILCPLGMGWVGSWVHTFTWLSWVGSVNWWVGLAWVVGSMKIDPRTTLRQTRTGVVLGAVPSAAV